MDVINEKTLYISSNDKDVTSESNSEFTVTLKEQYYTQNVIKIIIKEIQVPNVFYNVRSSYGILNSTIKIKENGQGDVSFSIVEGQYNSTQFISALQTAFNLNLVSGTVAITLDPITNKLNFVFTATSAIIYDLAAGNLMANIIGISTTTANLANITSDYIINLNGYSIVYLHSNLAVANGIDGDFGLINALESVNLSDVVYGQYGYRQNSDDELSSIVYETPRNFNQVTMRLRDDKGHLLPIGQFEITANIKAYFSR